ncbi:MAG: hypothetical protein HOE90_24365 [Bacteriovoracaceae bacterium]|jgi:neutral ceramidase|nr:hypothetical protein [Bacteriovoracaceae bacterium]
MNETTLLVGRSKSDITFSTKSVAMFGWADTRNTIKGVETPLYCRAVVLKEADSSKKIVMVNIEYCMISQALYLGIIRKLKADHPELEVTEQNLQVSANHTHSAPSGYCHYPIYNLPTPGYCKEIYNFLVDAIVKAVVSAHQSFVPGVVKYHYGAFAEDIPVAFNRSIIPYVANPDAERIPYGHRHKAIDRNMYLLRVEGEDGKPLASLNWFGVHCTSVKNTNNLISSDNKGWAAKLHEESINQNGDNPDFISLFMQSTGADVSPNYKLYFGLRGYRGAFRDMFESKNFNGKLQADQAIKLFDEASQKTPLKAQIGYLTKYNDLTNIEAMPEFSFGKAGAKTGDPALGIFLMKGANGEGSGIPGFIIFLIKMLSRLLTKNLSKVHGEKDIFIDCKRRTVFGIKRLYLLPVPNFVEMYVRSVKFFTKIASKVDFPFYHTHNPIQIFSIGNFAILGLPGEPTTTQGRRLRKSTLPQLAKLGIKNLVIAGYCNSYHGYITTYEEYQKQNYEGGHTVYGMWTGAAYQTLAIELSKQFVDEKTEKVELPTTVVPSSLERFMWSDFYPNL